MKKKLVAILLVIVSIFTVTITQLPAFADSEVTLTDLEQCNGADGYVRAVIIYVTVF